MLVMLAGTTLLPAADTTRAQPATAGDLVVDGRAVELGGEHVFDQVILRNGAVLTVTEYAGVLGGGELTLRARRIEVDATSRITADGAGWRGRMEGKGEGPGGGEGGEVSLAGGAPLPGEPHPTGSGAGGGYGGRGGDGIITLRRGEWLGGRPYGSAESDEIELGSAGGAPPPSHHEHDSIKGGNGGGAIRLFADEIIIAGEVSADGEKGPAATYDASGGGSGGGILIVAHRLDLSGTISAAGGPGGEAYDIGGAGGGGRVKITYTFGRADASRVDVRPGRGPCPGDRASPWGCEGTVHIVVLPPPPPAYLPLAMRGGCLDRDRRAIVLAIDTSASMDAPTRAGRPAIEAAKAAAGAFLARFGAEDRSGLVAFAGSAEVLQSLTDDSAATRAALGRLTLGHGSRLDLGLEAGQRVLGAARPGERRILVLVTDGLSSVSAGDVRAAADRTRALGTTIYALGIGAEVDAALLAAVAGDPARYLAVGDAEDLAGLYEAIAARERCGG